MLDIVRKVLTDANVGLGKYYDTMVWLNKHKDKIATVYNDKPTRQIIIILVDGISKQVTY